MAGRSQDDLERIKELVEVMRRNELLEIEISHGEDRIVLKRARPGEQPAAATPGIKVAGGDIPDKGRAAAEDEGLVTITSPIVGTFYSAPSPDSEPYVEVGSYVDPQTVVCIVEAMKVMNEIKPDVSGSVVEVCVKTGQAVEYGQSLFRVRPE